MPVDWYNGGMEHTTLHLLYSRFIFKFLWDIGAVPKAIGPEPYKKRTSHGMVLGQGGIKMSKSKGNVLNPDKVVKQYGADTLRIYEMFMGPFDQMIPWDTKGVVGVRRFLEKIYKNSQSIISIDIGSRTASVANAQASDSGLVRLLHKTIKKVGEDIEAMKFNTAVSSLMEFVNAWSRHSGMPPAAGLDRKDLAEFLKILSPLAPHLAEELWSAAGLDGLCCGQKWPKFNPKLIKEEKIMLIIQINGKVRDKISANAGLSQKEAEKLALASPKIQNWLAAKKPEKIIFIPDKLINIVASVVDK
jgi:leucyl-tRNA synthetase